MVALGALDMIALIFPQSQLNPRHDNMSFHNSAISLIKHAARKVSNLVWQMPKLRRY